MNESEISNRAFNLHRQAVCSLNAPEEEHAGLVLLDAAEIGLRQVIAGKRVSTDALLQALAGE